MNELFGHYPNNHAELHQCWLNYCDEYKYNSNLRFGEFMRFKYIKSYNNDLCIKLYHENDDMKAYKLCLDYIEKGEK